MTATAPVVPNRVREKLARDEVVASMTARLVRGVEIAQIAASAGFDSLYVDLEHGPLTIDMTGQICMAALAFGVTPFVRVPALSPEFIGRVLDAGALGIIAPHVHSAEQAQHVVRMARFPPLGTRSAAGHLPQFGFRAFPASVGDPALDAATMVVPMIETREALVRQRRTARCVRADHRRSARQGQACGHRRAGLAARSGGAVRGDGRALRLDRHRSRLPRGGLSRKGSAAS